MRLERTYWLSFSQKIPSRIASELELRGPFFSKNGGSAKGLSSTSAMKTGILRQCLADFGGEIVDLNVFIVHSP